MSSAPPDIVEALARELLALRRQSEESNALLHAALADLRTRTEYAMGAQAVILAALAALCAEHRNRGVLETQVRAAMAKLPPPPGTERFPAGLSPTAPDELQHPAIAHALRQLFPTGM